MNLKVIEKGFVLGLISRDELLNWSDLKLIEGNENEVFIELSSVTSIDDDFLIIDILNKYNSSKYDEKTFEKFHLIFLSYVLSNFFDWRIIQKKLLNYYPLNKEYLDLKEFEFWSRLKDDYELRNENFTGCMKMPFELKQYFDSYGVKKTNESFFENLLINFNC